MIGARYVVEKFNANITVIRGVLTATYLGYMVADIYFYEHYKAAIADLIIAFVLLFPVLTKVDIDGSWAQDVNELLTVIGLLALIFLFLAGH